jgi:restriction endonuclease Mrr
MDINQLLERIAIALEEQNRVNQQWIDINAVWQEENSANTERIIAIYKANAERDEQWRKAQQVMFEEQVRKQDALTQSAHDAYLEHLKEQAKPLPDEPIRKIVQEELERWERQLENRLRMNTGPVL